MAEGGRESGCILLWSQSREMGAVWGSCDLEAPRGLEEGSKEHEGWGGSRWGHARGARAASQESDVS